jgi:phosphoserine phosphatase
MAIISSKENINDKSYIAFFDLDRTIIKAVSGRALAVGAFKEGLMSPSDVANAIFLSFAYNLKLMDPLSTVEKMISWVKGLSEEKFNTLCSDVFLKLKCTGGTMQKQSCCLHPCHRSAVNLPAIFQWMILYAPKWKW